MTNKNTDRAFFTNDQHQTLLNRFKATLADTRQFDVLVGYFRASGFYRIYGSIDGIDTNHILIGLGIDHESWRVFEAARPQMQAVAILRKHIRRLEPSGQQTTRQPKARREIILFGYQVAANGE